MCHRLPTLFSSFITMGLFLFPKLKTAMNEDFYGDIPAIQAAATHVLKNIPSYDIEESMYKLVNRSKPWIKLNGDYFVVRDVLSFKS